MSDESRSHRQVDDPDVLVAMAKAIRELALAREESMRTEDEPSLEGFPPRLQDAIDRLRMLGSFTMDPALGAADAIHLGIAKGSITVVRTDEP
jgi:hypothetical protein